MKTRQMIFGIVAVVLIAGAAVTSAAATWRSPAHAAFTSNGSLMLADIKADVSKLSINDYEDMSLVFSKH
jgi:hypothetical protein